MGIRENRPDQTHTACWILEPTWAVACCLALSWIFAGQPSLWAVDAEDPDVEKERERIEDKLAGEKAIIENRMEDAERLLRRAARGEEASLAWRIDYNANLTRASRRLVENEQYDRAVETAQLVMGNLDAILFELEEAAALDEGDSNEEGESGGIPALKARALYLQGYLHERVFFDQDEAYRKYREASETDAESTTVSRALEKIPTRVKERVMEEDGDGET